MSNSRDHDFQLSVLVVDDEPSICSFLDEVLSHNGYSIAVACDGATALERLGEREFHLAIIDLSLPDSNGFDLVKRAKELRPDLVAIIMTGMELDFQDDIIANNVDDYLTKPFSLEHLIYMVAKYDKFLRSLHDLQRLDASLAREKRKSKFFNQAGHQLKSPVAVIKEFLQLFTEGFGGDLTGKQTQYLEAIDHHVNHLLYLIEGIENLSRVESGTWVMNKEAEDPLQIIKQLDDTWGLILERRNLKFVTEIAPGLPPVLADATAVEQVLGNLIDNASKYSTPGTTVTLRCWLEGDHLVCFELENEGPGIPEEQRAAVFQPFSRLPQHESLPGLGLGLTVALELAKRMDGDLILDGGGQSGARFRLHLPVA